MEKGDGFIFRPSTNLPFFHVSIQATQSIDNDSVRRLQATQGGAGHSIDSAVSGQSQPLVVRLNELMGSE